MIKAIDLYKKYRIPHVGRYAGTGKLYFHQVIAKSAWESAVRNAEIINKWEQLEDDEKVRLQAFSIFDPFPALCRCRR